MNTIFNRKTITKSENKLDTDKLDEVMKVLIEMRAEARVDKNFALSDRIRDGLSSIGITLKDSREGTSYEIES